MMGMFWFLVTLKVLRVAFPWIGGFLASLFLARSGLHQIDGAPVIDTISASLKMAEMLVKMGWIMGAFVSRRGSFLRPPDDLLKQVSRDYGIEMPM